MNAKRLRTIICVTAIATMLFSSMGIGAFATVEQGAPQGEVQAQGEAESTDTEQPAIETPQAEETPAVTEDAPTPDVKASGDADVPAISPNGGKVEVGKTLTLTAANFGDGVTVTWKSSEESVATVDGGVVTGVAVGKTTITATEVVDPADDSVTPKEASCEVTVEPAYAFTKNSSIMKTLSGHQRIKVIWTPAAASVNEGTGADNYYIGQYIVQRAPQGSGYRNYCTINMNENGTVNKLTGDAVGSYKTSSYWTKEAATAGVSGDTLYFEDKDVGDGLMDNATKKFRGGVFTYRIIPVVVKKDGTTMQGSVSNAMGDTCVRTSYVALKIKVNKSLTSHDKQHVKRYFKKGTTIYTCAFGYGRYQFIYNGNMYWLNRVGTKSHKSGYDRGHPYSAEEAAYYVNTSPYGSSSTSKLVWVNTYCQRIYVFTGRAGKWSPMNGNGWYVSTGKAATPTIRYMDPKSPILDTGRIVGKCKTINKKVKKRHGIPCWNCFSTWNAIHGQKKSWSIKGVPKSNGCVRNTNAHAKYIYNTCPKNTRVLIF